MVASLVGIGGLSFAQLSTGSGASTGVIVLMCLWVA